MYISTRTALKRCAFVRSFYGDVYRCQGCKSEIQASRFVGESHFDPEDHRPSCWVMESMDMHGIQKLPERQQIVAEAEFHAFDITFPEMPISPFDSREDKQIAEDLAKLGL